MPVRLRRRLRTHLLALLVALPVGLVAHAAGAAIPVLPAPSAFPAEARDVVFDETFRVRSGGRLSVDLGSEDVVIETGRGSEARVRVEARGRDARRAFEQRRFTAVASGGDLSVRTQPRRGMTWGRSGGASFTVTVTVPARYDVAVDLGSGDVRVASVQGDVAVDTGSGDVTLADVDGARVVLDTGSGDVTAGRLEARTVRIDTGSGDVAVDAVDGDLTVDTGSGDVRVGEVSGRVTADTGSGDVRLGVRRVAAMEISTGSGAVVLTLPRRTDATLAASGGSVTVDRALAFDGRQDRRSARGRLGRGGPDLSIDTGSGAIRLDAR